MLLSDIGLMSSPDDNEVQYGDERDRDDDGFVVPD